MVEQEQKCCTACGTMLKGYEVRSGEKRCKTCSAQKRVVSLLAEESIQAAFSKLWIRGLFARFGAFLEKHDIPFTTRIGMLPKVMRLFQEADRCFGRPTEMSEAWLEEMITKMGRAFTPTFFRRFLIEERFLPEKDSGQKRIELTLAKVEELPEEYRRVVSLYIQGRIALREKQIAMHAKRPLAGNSIWDDFLFLLRLVRWLKEHALDLRGWNMVQEEHILTFLLTLPPKSREIARGDLLTFFRFARKKKLMAHVPLTYYPAKELPRASEPLSVEEQKALARLLQQSISTHPEEVFLTTLCFYYGLSTTQIFSLQISSVDVERGIIHLEGRPLVYFLAEDLFLLEQFLRKRKTFPYAEKRKHLIISNRPKIDDEPVWNEYITQKVRTFTGYTPRLLRMTCFTVFSAFYGPQYLVEVFGLSVCHAARYGKLEEFLLEEEVRQQRKEFLEMARQLES